MSEWVNERNKVNSGIAKYLYLVNYIRLNLSWSSNDFQNNLHIQSRINQDWLDPQMSICCSTGRALIIGATLVATLAAYPTVLIPLLTPFLIFFQKSCCCCHGSEFTPWTTWLVTPAAWEKVLSPVIPSTIGAAVCTIWFPIWRPCLNPFEKSSQNPSCWSWSCCCHGSELTP